MEEDEGNSEWPIASFFKILNEPRDNICKLEIPSKFLALHGKALYELVNLHMPSGRVWHINLLRKKGKVYLQNGWPKFAKFYSLSPGYFLKFDFIGNSSFKVIILDMGASEIQYPHFTPCNMPHQSLQNKGKSTNITSMPSSPSEEVTNEIITGKGKLPITPPTDIIISTKGLKSFSFAEIDKINAYSRAHPIEHPAFAVRFPTHYCHYHLSIPSKFVRRYMDVSEENDEFIIENKAGKKSKVLIYGGLPSMKFTGCQEFITDNKLQVNDICVFQLNHKQQFKVDILRAARPQVVELD